MTPAHRPTSAIAPGDLDPQEFIDALVDINRERHDDPTWAFDTEQRRAILHDGGPMQLTAGPGAGKTEVMVASVLKWLLVDGVPPGGIVLTTFTEKAAEELHQRLEAHVESFGYGDAIAVDDIYVGTNHQLWGEIMREFRFEGYRNVELLDADAQEMFVTRTSDYVDILADGDAAAFPSAVQYLHDDGTCSKAIAASAATTLFNRLSQFRVDVDALADADDSTHRRLADAYRDYRAALNAHSRCDFARLQERFLDFLETETAQRFVHGDPERDRPPLQRIAVDEYQDVNPLQQAIYFRLAELMEDAAPTIVVCGDDDQALYRFRGGTVDCLIEFPDRIADRLDIDHVTSHQLRTNYRSRPEIVDWSNRHISDNPAMQHPGARAPGKEPMQANGAAHDEHDVLLLNGDTKADAAARFADAVQRLHDENVIEDYRQVALLAHSTREYWPQWESRTFVGACVDELEAHGIDVHNPRNKAFLEHEEIQAMLGALARCLDPDLQWAADNVIEYGGLGDIIETWLDTLDQVIDQHDATDLAAYIDDVDRRIRETAEGDPLRLSPVDLFNRLRSLPPFSTWTETDREPARTERLGKLSQLLESFEGIAQGLTDDRRLVRTTHDAFDTTSVLFLSDFYWTFCQYLENVALDDPEDPYDTFPADHVQVMTFHQAKGLEFPITFVGSLDRTPEKIVDRGDASNPVPRLADQFAPYTERTPPADVPTRVERDLVRQFYVGHSRARDKLVLLGADYYLRPADGDTVVPSLGAEDGTPLTEEWFDPDQRVDGSGSVATTDSNVFAHSTGGPKRSYSIVADVLAFRRCQRQYGYHTDYEFAAGSGTQLFAGLAVHQTLDWAHRYYTGDTEEAGAGGVPSREALRDEFENVVESLRARRILPMGRAAVDAVFEHIARFNRTIGPDLYPNVEDTECRLRYNAGQFLLTGVADVIADDDGRTRLCDYKASQRPGDDEDGFLEDYREQLLVYAGLYAHREGELPDGATLYFLAEDDPESARLDLEFTDSDVRDAMDRFEDTVSELEATRTDNTWSDMDPSDVPDEATCAECDARWDCPYREYDDR